MIALAAAYLCVGCECVVEGAAGGACACCGSRALLSLDRVLNRQPPLATSTTAQLTAAAMLQRAQREGAALTPMGIVQWLTSEAQREGNADEAARDLAFLRRAKIQP